VLLRAWALLRDQRQLPGGWELVIIGDGPEREALIRLKAELKLGDEVQLPGAESNDRVLERMKTCEVFALPCRQAADGDRDGIPVVLMEAMAAGVPVVCGDLETIRELVADKKSGLLVEPGSEIKLAEALSVVLNSVTERQRMGHAARARVVEEFSLEGNLDRLEAAFASAMATGAESGKKHG
jgi:glycosyltransferase involved in cell wall biosynthesis